MDSDAVSSSWKLRTLILQPQALACPSQPALIGFSGTRSPGGFLGGFGSCFLPACNPQGLEDSASRFELVSLCYLPNVRECPYHSQQPPLVGGPCS